MLRFVVRVPVGGFPADKINSVTRCRYFRHQHGTMTLIIALPDIRKLRSPHPPAIRRIVRNVIDIIRSFRIENIIDLSGIQRCHIFFIFERHFLPVPGCHSVQGPPDDAGPLIVSLLTGFVVAQLIDGSPVIRYGYGSEGVKFTCFSECESVLSGTGD